MSHSFSRTAVETLANLAVVGNVPAVRRALDGVSAADQRRLIAEADQFGQSPLDHAARQGHAALLRFFRTELLDDDVAALATLSATRNATRQTPLIGAADAGQLEVVQELVQHWHADAYARDENGYTALHCAAASDNAEVIEFLIGAGECQADMLRGSDDKHTPLHSAATFGSTAALRALVRLGANVNAVESNFRATPLALAIFNRHADCVATLLDAGADLDRHRNSHGHTAFDLAQTSSPEVRALVDAARTARRARRIDDDDWGEILGEADSTVAVLAEPGADDLLAELDDIVVEDPDSWQLDAAAPQPAMPPVAVLEALLSVLRGLTELAPAELVDEAPAMVLRAPFC